MLERERARERERRYEAWDQAELDAINAVEVPKREEKPFSLHDVWLEEYMKSW